MFLSISGRKLVLQTYMAVKIKGECWWRGSPELLISPAINFSTTLTAPAFNSSLLLLQSAMYLDSSSIFRVFVKLPPSLKKYSVFVNVAAAMLCFLVMNEWMQQLCFLKLLLILCFLHMDILCFNCRKYKLFGLFSLFYLCGHFVFWSFWPSIRKSR